MTSQSTIHGSLFVLLENFLVSNFGTPVWEKLSKVTPGGVKKYDLHENYPLTEFEIILTEASSLTGVSESDLKERFGEMLVPSLIKMYGRYVDPSWKTFQLLEFTELVMHKAVRKEESRANPPVLNVSRVHDKLLIIDYYSKRKMGSLAVGIINGIAAYYDEKDRVHVIPITNPNEERVQIRVEFD